MILNYRLLGCDNSDKPHLICIHGLFGSADNLNVVAKPLSETFQVVNIDVTNHGQSPHVAQISYPQMASDVIDTLKHLNIEQAYFVGHSMGGKIAMQCALTHPNLVLKLVVLDIAPVNYQPRHFDVFAGLSAVLLDKIASRKEAENQMQTHIQEAGVRAFLLKSLAQENGVFSWRFNLEGLIENYDAILAAPCGEAYQGETLFIKGANSDYITAEHRDEITTLFPQSKAKIITGAGHWLHAEKPQAIVRSILDFIIK